MRKSAILLVWLIAQTTALTAPPNDDFANRIVLEGGSIVFTGSLSGATLEQHYYGNDSPSNSWEMLSQRAMNYWGSGVGTVWWQWTAPTDSTVIIEALQYSTNAFRFGAMSVWRGTNGLMCDDCGSMDSRVIACTPFDSGRRSFLAFTAAVGEQYQFQVSGPDVPVFTLRLTATTSPVFIIHPVTQSANIGGSIFLGGLAAGAGSKRYQWRFNGVDLPGQNFHILSIDHLTTNHAGEYRLAVSNDFGSAVSDPAYLFVSPEDNAPSLQLSLTAGQMALSVLGETGRTYRVESSTDLLTWTPEVNFPGPISYVTRTRRSEIIFNTNGAATFVLPSLTVPRFFRAARYSPQNDECNNNLKKIRFCKELAALDRQIPGNAHDFPVQQELTMYMGAYPRCPTGGFYSINNLVTLPSCTEYHIVEEPDY